MRKLSWSKNRRLGQHFLNNKKILEEMARAAKISKQDIVLEVGPGMGSLTEILAARAKKVIAVEKDRELIPVLREKFKDFKNMEIIEGDVLKIFNFQFPIFNKFKNFKVVANLPYYITSRFLRLFLSETKFRSKLIVLMVQKEVAERICAKPPRMNLLALSVQAYAEPEIIRYVSKNFFSPPPKVDSVIIKITPLIPLTLRGKAKKSSPLKVRGAGGVMGVEKILAVAKIAFQQKRKMLRHSIGKKITLPEKYQNKRPEELSLKDWAEILRYN
ncbi:MAG: ribosomal RNA small subunit methyltransferase A [Candidatus Giovannonibacteria bacterium]|nr:MAG: ribosomal RNA small subunit methyltransferase A [Candidatus Giovannonibacteria bacterium]